MLYSVWTCPACGHEWSVPAPEVTTEHIVRAYDNGETEVGFVDRIDGDSLEVCGREVQRWQVVIY